MTRTEAWLQHLGNLLVGGTGLVYAWTCYVAEPQDPFAIVNHPWQPGLRSAHIVVAPLLVFGLGLVWREHVWARVRSGFLVRRRSGLVLALLAIPMIASGYLLQVTIDETWKALWIGAHLATSLPWIAIYVIHQLSPRPGVSD